MPIANTGAGKAAGIVGEAKFMSFPRKNGPWTVNSERSEYENPWIRVEHNEVIHPDGSDGIYGVVRFANLAVGVLPIDDDGNVWLVGQHRFAFDRYSWELPEGGVPKSEDPLEGAKRELAEETGFTADHWVELSRFDISNSVTDERAVCYLAYGLKPGDMSPDPSEVLKIKRLPFGELLRMVMSGEITDSLTIIMTLMAREMAKPVSVETNAARCLPSTMPHAIWSVLRADAKAP